MNDKQRCNFLDRLSRGTANVSPGEASFIDSLGESNEFTPAQRERIDRLHERNKEQKRGGIAKDKFIPPVRDREIEARLNACRCGQPPKALRHANGTHSAHCCGGLTHNNAEALVAHWNILNPQPAAK